jgi:hypothetical protein
VKDESRKQEGQKIRSREGVVTRCTGNDARGPGMERFLLSQVHAAFNPVHAREAPSRLLIF